MADNLKDPGPLDGKFISLKEDHEVAYWTKALGVTRAQLEDAVAAVGNSAKAVREHLGLPPA